jgi:hypothetical protein
MIALERGIEMREKRHTSAPAEYTPALLAVALFIHSGFLNFQRRSSGILPVVSQVCIRGSWVL